MGGVLGQFGLRAIPFGIAAMVLGFILKSAGTQAGPADTLELPFGQTRSRSFTRPRPKSGGPSSRRRTSRRNENVASPAIQKRDATETSPPRFSAFDSVRCRAAGSVACHKGGRRSPSLIRR